MSDQAFRRFFLVVLDDSHGISGEAFEIIKDEMTARGCEDIIDAVEASNGRVFINEDFAEAELARIASAE